MSPPANQAYITFVIMYAGGRVDPEESAPILWHHHYDLLLLFLYCKVQMFCGHPPDQGLTTA